MSRWRRSIDISPTMTYAEDNSLFPPSFSDHNFTHSGRYNTCHVQMNPLSTVQWCKLLVNIMHIVHDSRPHRPQDALHDSSPWGMSTVCHAARSIRPHHMETFLQICMVLDALPDCISLTNFPLICSLGLTDWQACNLVDSLSSGSIRPCHWEVSLKYLFLLGL